MRRVLLLSSLYLLVPHFVSAALLINEVAWMGTEASANDEWIELYNSGTEAIAVDGWVLSDGVGLEIVLAGRVAAGQYAVLERTDDDSAPGTAFMVYTGALPNDGRTLTLRREDGSIADQVAGGEDWQNIGGDNERKYTAQYTERGWVTAAATPGAHNASETAVAEADETSDDVETLPRVSSSVSEGSSKPQVQLTVPDSELRLAIIAPDTGYVNQELTFAAAATGIGERLIDSLSYEWNFGDLTTSGAREPQHHFTHSGTYVVTLYASYARHEAVARHTITILPRSLLLATTSNGLLIHNQSPYEIDLSGYVLKGRDEIVLPPRTIISERGSIPVLVHDEVATMYALYDTAGQIVSSILPDTREPTPAVNSAVVVGASAPALSHSVAVAPTPRIAATSTSRTNPMLITEAAAASLPSDQPVAQLAAGTAVPADKLPYLGLMALLTVSILAVYTTKRQEG